MFHVVLHKVLHRAVCITASVLFVLNASAQEPAASHRIQAVVMGLRAPFQARQVDILLRYQPGVLMTRTDFNSRNMLLEVEAGCALNAEAINDLLAPHQLSLRCYRRIPLNTTPFALLDPRGCLEDPK